jgi:hypothetical protein
MSKLILGVMLLAAQLSGPGSSLPQILHPEFKSTAAIRAGQQSEVTVSFNLLNGYAINHTPPMNLKLTQVAGIVLPKTDFTTPSNDPKSKDEYYAELPTIKVPIVAAKAGKYEVPAKLKYYFCHKSDGFCSIQNLDLKIPVLVQ